MDINGACVPGVVITPNFFQELFSTEDQAPVPGQEGEQVKLLGRQVKSTVAKAGPTTGDIKDEVIDANKSGFFH